MAVFCLTQKQGFEIMKKTITLLVYGASIGFIHTPLAVARTCNSIYIIKCPTQVGEPNCCRSSSETCILAGCASVEIATCPSTCPLTTWQDVSGTNYQTKCNVSTCAYQCKAGYYGSNQSCTACPSSGTSLAGSTLISDCYLPDGTTGSDSSGNWKIEGGNCYYSNMTLNPLN